MSLHAEVITTREGEVIVGQVESKSAEKVSLRAFGTVREIAVPNIESSATTLDTVKSAPVVIYLKDQSILRGKIRDFSEDIGAYVDTEIGSITVPAEKILRINLAVSDKNVPQPTENSASHAPLSNLTVGVAGLGSYAPLSPNLRLGLGGLVYVEQAIRTRFVSHVGISGGFESIASTQANWRLAEATTLLYARKNFSPFGAGLQKVTFTLALGGGAAFAMVQDERASTSNTGTAIGVMAVKGGISVQLMRALHLRCELVNMFRLIQGANLWKPGIELGVSYAF